MCTYSGSYESQKVYSITETTSPTAGQVQTAVLYFMQEILLGQ